MQHGRGTSADAVDVGWYADVVAALLPPSNGGCGVYTTSAPLSPGAGGALQRCYNTALLATTADWREALQAQH